MVVGAVLTPTVGIDVLSGVNWVVWSTALVIFVACVTWFVFYVISAVFGGLL